MNQNHDEKERSVVNKMSTYMKKKKNVFIYICICSVYSDRGKI